MQNQVGGLSVILDQIEKESKAVIAETESKAKKETDRILAAAKAEADKITAEAKAAADKAYGDALERDKNAMEHSLTQSLLAEKQRLLDGVISESVKSISGIDGYYDFLKDLARRYLGDEAGRLLMSENDIKNMPDDFKEFVKSEFPKLEAEASSRVKSGFIAVYDDIDIEENCTLAELADANMDSIKEKVQNILFK